MSNIRHESVGSVSRSYFAGRIAGAAVAAALFLGAPIVATLTLGTGVASADIPDINLDFETCANGKKLSDCDGDGLENWYEIKTLRTKAYLADTDGDGINDGMEVRAHTDPLDPQSFPFDFNPRGLGNFNFGGF